MKSIVKEVPATIKFDIEVIKKNSIYKIEDRRYKVTDTYIVESVTENELFLSTFHGTKIKLEPKHFKDRFVIVSEMEIVEKKDNDTILNRMPTKEQMITKAKESEKKEYLLKLAKDITENNKTIQQAVEEFKQKANNTDKMTKEECEKAMDDYKDNFQKKLNESHNKEHKEVPYDFFKNLYTLKDIATREIIKQSLRNKGYTI